MKPRVLVVEDEIMAYDKICYILEENYSIYKYTKTAEEALEAIISFKPAVILIDIELAGNMDGIHLAEIISDKFHIPSIFLTSKNDNETIERLRDLTYSYVAKPITRASLISNIRSAILVFNQTCGGGISGIYLPKKDESSLMKIKEKVWFDSIIHISNAKNKRNCYHIFSENERIHERRESLSKLHEELPRYFVRIHQSHFINIYKIAKREYTTNSVIMSNGKRIPIGEKYSKNVNSFLKYFFS